MSRGGYLVWLARETPGVFWNPRNASLCRRDLDRAPRLRQRLTPAVNGLPLRWE